MPGEHVAETEAASIDKAIAALEGQRGALGDHVVDTALVPLQQRRAELDVPQVEQRRLVTVVFADLVDFTTLSRRLDAEDTREVVGAYFARWQRAIEEHGGVVEKFIGDAVMAVFGLRRSYEDDAHRAVRAALSIVDGLEELNAEIEPRLGVRLHLRVGIDTGEVVVSTLGERAGHEFVAVGPTVNRASRLQAAAPVDTVLVSAETRRQIRGSFGLEEREPLQLKGIDEPVPAWVVHTERRSGFKIERAGGVEGIETTTVGRDLQLRFLQERLHDVTDDSRWRVVTVMGDAGLGKSRLLYDFDAWLAERSEPVWWFRGRAAPSTQHTVNGLLRDLLSSRLGLQVDDSRDVVRTALSEGFTQALGAEAGPRAGALVGAWLGFDVDTDAFELPTDPQALRDQGTESLGRYFHALAQQAAVVVLLEDLHWADEGTLRWLDAVDPVLADARVLVVATSRPMLQETHPRWGEGLGHHVRLDLPALSRRESRQLVGQILQRVEHVPARLTDLVVDTADGNPYYLEELLAWLVDAGVVVKAEPHWLVVDELVERVAVPSTLKGILQSRLDALSGDERDVLQRAAVVGRVFWDTAVAALAQAELDGSLDDLRRREVLLQRERSQFSGTREYLFKHALLRDVAYDGVLRQRREAYHRAAAEWLARTSAAVGRSDEYAAVIAEHFEQARDPEAAGWYLVAARQALSVYALNEGRRLLDQAGRLVAGGEANTRFDILLARESLLDRLGDRDGQHSQVAAMTELEERLDPGRRVELLTIRGKHAFAQSEYDEARRITGLAVQEATAIHRDDLRAEAMLLQGKALTWADDPGAAEGCLQQAVELGRLAGVPAVVGEGLRYLGMVRGNVGDYQSSLDLTSQAREVFARLGDTEMESAAVAQHATTLFNMARYDEARAALEEALPIFHRAGHAYREAIALSNLASIAAVQGHFGVTVRYAHQAIEMCRAMGEQEAIAVDLLVLAHAELFTDQLDLAREHAEAALAIGRELDDLGLQSDSVTRLVHIALVADDLDLAVDLGLQGVELGRTASSDLDRGYAHLTVGYALRWAGRFAEADHHFAEAAGLFAGLDLAVLTRECTVAQAWALASAGDHERAVAMVAPVLDRLGRDDMIGALLPATMLRGCVEVLRLAGDDRAEVALASARAYVHATAEGIDDPVLRAGYLAIPPNAVLLQAGGPPA